MWINSLTSFFYIFLLWIKQHFKDFEKFSVFFQMQYNKLKHFLTVTRIETFKVGMSRLNTSTNEVCLWPELISVADEDNWMRGNMSVTLNTEYRWPLPMMCSSCTTESLHKYQNTFLNYSYFCLSCASEMRLLALLQIWHDFKWKSSEWFIVWLYSDELLPARLSSHNHTHVHQLSIFLSVFSFMTQSSPFSIYTENVWH